MGLRGFGHDDAVMADFVLLNDPTADTDGAVNCTMALVDFMRYFTGKAIALRPKQRETEADRPRRLRCELRAGTQPGVYYFERRGEPADLPEDFSGWIACAPHDGVAHATTAHRTFLRCTRTEDGGVQLPPELLPLGQRVSGVQCHHQPGLFHGAAGHALLGFQVGTVPGENDVVFMVQQPRRQKGNDHDRDRRAALQHCRYRRTGQQSCHRVCGAPRQQAAQPPARPLLYCPAQAVRPI